MPTLPDLDAAIREAIVNASSVTSLLSSYKGSYPVFTRRPIPADAPYPCIIVMDNTTLAHEDGVDDQRIRVVREIVVYAAAHNPLPSEQWRKVDDIGRALVNLFHRNPSIFNITGWTVVDVRVAARGQPPADVLAQDVGFTAILNMFLAAQN